MTHASNKSAPDLVCLQPLAGKWHTEGQQIDGPFGPAAPFVAVETFEWLDGGHFLVHRLDGKFGQRPAACMEILGRNPAGELFAQSFYNDGHTNTWRLAEDSQTLVLSGGWAKGEADGHQVRCTVSFTEAGNTMNCKWEQSRDGQSWLTFMDTHATKAQPLPSASVGA